MADLEDKASGKCSIYYASRVSVFFRKKFKCAESCAEEITYLLYTLSIPLV